MGYETGQVITGKDISLTSSGFEVTEMSGEERSERLGRIGVDWLGLAAGTKGAQKLASKSGADELWSRLFKWVKTLEPEFITKYRTKLELKRLLARSKRTHEVLGEHELLSADNVNAQYFPEDTAKGTAPFLPKNTVTKFKSGDSIYVRAWSKWDATKE